MNRTLTVVVTLLVAAGSLSACGSTATPIPQAKDCTAAGVTCTPTADPGLAADPTPAAPVPTEVPVAEATPAASTCDVVKEALLTGTPRSIKAAMKHLQADKSADGTAREYASYYLVRDAGNKQLREMDVNLIQMSCGG